MSTATTRRAQIYVALQFVLIAIFAATVFLDSSAAVPMPPAAKWLGLALCALGLAIGAAALAAMGRVMQVSPVPKAEGHLITNGVYAKLRHPMYTGIVLIAVGLLLRKPTLGVAIAAAALIVLLVVKSRFEERLLRERYPGYEQYSRRTWGVIPGL